MKKKGKARTYAYEKNCEMLAFYYAIFSNRIRRGLNAANARKEACDAVELRYNISKGRLLNIISEQNYSQSVNIGLFRDRVLTLIVDLKCANNEMDDAKEKNNKLIALLKECIEDEG